MWRCAGLLRQISPSRSGLLCEMRRDGPLKKNNYMTEGFLCFQWRGFFVTSFFGQRRVHQEWKLHKSCPGHCSGNEQGSLLISCLGSLSSFMRPRAFLSNISFTPFLSFLGQCVDMDCSVERVSFSFRLYTLTKAKASIFKKEMFSLQEMNLTLKMIVFITT